MENLPPKYQDLLNRLEGVKETSDGWISKCPCSYHNAGKGDKNPSLRIAVGENGRILLLCRTGCKTDDVLNAIGLIYKDLYLDEFDKFALTSTKKTKKLSQEEIDTRSYTYNHILENLSLEEDHRLHLEQRGFFQIEINILGYRSIRKSTLQKCIKEISSRNISLVPGLQENCSEFAYSGIAIPVRDYNGNIIAIKIRRFQDGRKYTYLSDALNSSGTHIHWPSIHKKEQEDHKNNLNVRITEGEFKADYLTIKKTDEYTISLPGVRNWKLFIDVVKDKIDKQGNIGNIDITVAFDYPDVVNKTEIRMTLKAFLKALDELKVPVSIEVWNQLEFKGIDDLIANGHTPNKVIGYENCKDWLDKLEEKENLEAECIIIPEPIIKEFKIKDFPVEVFPNTVKNLCESITSRTDAPLDFSGLASIVVAASAIGSARKIKIIPGWLESPCIYASIIAVPGSGKSPAIGRIQRPIILKQREAVSKFKVDMEAYDKDKSKTLPKPTLREYFSTDITIAGVTDRLTKNSKGILLSPDEIMAWIKSFGTIGLGNDQDYFLSIWNGQPVKVDRKGGDTPVSWIDFPYVSVLGSIQPKRLRELSSGGRGEDGFLDRFLFSFPTIETPSQWELSDFYGMAKDDSIMFDWMSCVSRLYSLDFIKNLPGIINMTEEGWKYSCDWYNNTINRDLCDPDFPDHLKGFWLKLKSYYFRFALIMELLYWADGTTPEPKEISVKNLERAALLCEYFKEHARKVAHYSSPSEELLQIEELLKLVQKKSGMITAKEIVEYNNSILPRKLMDAKNLLITCANYGYGNYVLEKDGKKDIFLARRT